MVIKMQLVQLLGVEEVIEADNGQSAVEMARIHTPELAILDLDIPRISGLDVIPRLKLVHPPIRVMVLSSHDPATFAKMSSFLVARYQAGLAAYEVWNEPDQANENYWAGPNKVARYVALTKAV